MKKKTKVWISDYPPDTYVKYKLESKNDYVTRVVLSIQMNIAEIFDDLSSWLINDNNMQMNLSVEGYAKKEILEDCTKLWRKQIEFMKQMVARKGPLYERFLVTDEDSALDWAYKIIGGTE